MMFCIDRTEEFRDLAGLSSGRAARNSDVRPRNKLLVASSKAVGKWREAERNAGDGAIPLAQLRRAARFSLQHVLEHGAALSDQHEQHVRLALLDLLAHEETQDCVVVAPEVASDASSTEEQARTRVLAQLTAPDEYYSERATAMRRVNRDLVRTGALMVRVGSLVGEQAELVERLAHNVERADARIGAAHNELLDAAPRGYATWRWRARTYCVPHSLSARLRLCFVALVALNIALFALDIL